MVLGFAQGEAEKGGRDPGGRGDARVEVVEALWGGEAADGVPMELVIEDEALHSSARRKLAVAARGSLMNALGRVVHVLHLLALPPHKLQTEYLERLLHHCPKDASAPSTSIATPPRTHDAKEARIVVVWTLLHLGFSRDLVQLLRLENVELPCDIGKVLRREERGLKEVVEGVLGAELGASCSES